MFLDMIKDKNDKTQTHAAGKNNFEKHLNTAFSRNSSTIDNIQTLNILQEPLGNLNREVSTMAMKMRKLRDLLNGSNLH